MRNQDIIKRERSAHTDLLQRNIFTIMEGLEGYFKSTKNDQVKQYIKEIIEEIGCLINYSEYSDRDLNKMARIFTNYISPILDLLELEKKYQAIPTSNSGTIVNVEGSIKEIKEAFELEAKRLYCLLIKDAASRILLSKRLDEEMQRESKVEVDKLSEKLLNQGNNTIKPSINQPTIQNNTDSKFELFSLPAVIVTALAWFLFNLTWPENYTTNPKITVIFVVAVYGIIRLLVHKFEVKEVEAQEETKTEIDSIVARLEINSEVVRNKAKLQIERLIDYNKQIPDDEVSHDLDEIVESVQSIIVYLEKYPNQAHSMNKFLDYYLPTLMDLLEIYQKYDDMPNLSAEMKNTLGNIEDSLATMKGALKSKLIQFYQDETMEAGSNITALNTLLHQDGLLEDDFSQEIKKV